MDPTPIIEAPAAVQAHLAFVAAAATLSVALLAMPKGRGRHRALGRAWVGAMGATALSGLAIPAHGASWLGFGPLHLLSLLVLFNLVQGVRAIRGGNLRAHRAVMLSLIAGGLGVAGGFAILGEGRVLNTALMGG